jgi:triosephosphate isomerase
MRKLFVAGNWKMNLDLERSCALAGALKAAAGTEQQVTLAVCPPAVYLKGVADVLQGSNIAVGGQNMYTEPKGAFTGEVSGPMLLDVGCTCVILGHSERRHVFGESDELISRKVPAALQYGLRPIVCVGETLAQREDGRTDEVVSCQVESALEGVGREEMQSLTLAYEPVWAIGTGRNATPQQADEVHSMVRSLVADLYDAEVADALVIQYGGSVKPANAEQLLSCQNVDGALVGGASLAAETFVPIIEAARSLSRG